MVAGESFASSSTLTRRSTTNLATLKTIPYAMTFSTLPGEASRQTKQTVTCPRACDAIERNAARGADDKWTDAQIPLHPYPSQTFNRSHNHGHGQNLGAYGSSRAFHPSRRTVSTRGITKNMRQKVSANPKTDHQAEIFIALQRKRFTKPHAT